MKVMPKLILKRVGGWPYPERPPEIRIKDFDPVTLNYTPEQAVEEAKRCILCPLPACVKACPVKVDVPGMMKAVASGNFAEGAKILRETNCLGGTTGSVCPQLGGLCEASCVLNKNGEPVAIGMIQKFLIYWEIQNNVKPVALNVKPTGHSVAIVGAGPAGLAAADLLLRYGHDVTIFEAMPEAGGTALYGIPSFHLDKSLIRHEVNYLKEMGVKIKTNVMIGRDLRIKDLFNMGFEAVLITTGPSEVIKLNVPGEDLKGVYSAYSFLTDINRALLENRPLSSLPYKLNGGRYIIVGGGDTAYDAAKMAVRLGASEVIIMYRRTEKEMPGYWLSREEAKKEGVKIMPLTVPIKFIGDENGWVKQAECIRMRLGEPDASGRPRPIPIPGSNFIVDVDVVLIAIGRRPNKYLAEVEGLKLNEHGGIAINPETYETSIPRVYAAGDVVTGETLVVKAMAEGRKAAQRIHEMLMGLTEHVNLDKKYYDERYSARFRTTAALSASLQARESH